MGENLVIFRRQWARVLTRVATPWEREFATTVAHCMELPGWEPTQRQAAKISAMIRVYRADVPDVGERLVNAKGETVEWEGEYRGWVRVYQ